MKIMPVSNVPGQFIFWCPGCHEHHGVWTDPEHPNKVTGSKWTFDGNMERPTFSPSILTIGRTRCHLHIVNGEIHYCSDCDHALAGKAVPMEDVHV